MIARIVVIIAALAVAIAAALVFLPIAALLDPVTRAAGAAFSASSVFVLIFESFAWSDPKTAGATFLFALWGVAVTVCVAPVLIVSLIGEVAGTASALFYVSATGIVTAGLPWIIRTRHLGATDRIGTMSDVELRIALLLFLTGACAGLVYWLIAGRGAGRASPRPRT